MEYKELNKATWNSWAALHLHSAFYEMPAFLSGKSSLQEIETMLLGNIHNKSILHLQCHFGQDTLSLARMGGKATGVDISDKAIEIARSLNDQLRLDARFVCCDIFDLNDHLEDKFDIVFSSYGTIGWLPELESWAKTIAHFLKPGGEFIFVEFHPAVWMFDDNLDRIQYSYFKSAPIVETVSGSYANKDATVRNTHVTWNHGLGEVVQSLISNSIRITHFEEYDFSPVNCFPDMEEYLPGKFRIKKYGKMLPLVYAIKGIKT